MHGLPPDFDSLLRAATRIAAPPLCPELRLHLAGDLDALWAEQERRVGRTGLAAPFWGVAWPGGQALARHVMDNPVTVAGRSVLDLGSGSGLVAIAAARAGARVVEAADTDDFARAAIAANASLNQVALATLAEDLIGAPSRWDVVLAADLWYERFLAGRVTAWLSELAASGTRVLVGDRGRAFLRREGLEELQRYQVPSPSFERDAVTATGVWQVGRSRIRGPS
ncbi:MAG: 50S ribosomal protein L11 methyltransferase [Usitatibacter sp.]